MNKSYQTEIPKSRINITLDLVTGDAKKKQELPLKLLALGNYSNHDSQQNISEKKRINVNKNNFDAVLKSLSPKLNLAVKNRIAANDTDLNIQINIKRLKDFHPDEIIKQIPELRNLIAMRNLLKDLKANLSDNSTLRCELEAIIKNKLQFNQLRKQLERL